MALYPQLRVISTSAVAQACTTTPCHAAQIHHAILNQVQCILLHGPTSSGEAWIYEYAKYLRGDLDAKTMKFQVSILQKGFEASCLVFPPAPGFLDDVCGLIAMLPLSVGTVIERRLLIDLLKEAARECNMSWWHQTRENAAIVFGVMHACMIYRNLEAEKQNDDDLSTVMGEIDLSAEHIDVVKRLAESLEGGLKL